jgi:hypothetical protein
MKHGRANNLTWATASDQCWIPYVNILRTVPTPSAMGQSARQYRLDKGVVENIEVMFTAFRKNHAN